jgi:hypothetical protein
LIVAMNLSLLTQPIPDWSESAALLTGVDDVLAGGLSRLSESQQQALLALAAGLDGSPVGAAVRSAVDRIATSEFTPSACLGLAVARCALAGALHDALHEQLASAVDFTVSVVDSTVALPVGELAPLLAGVQQWLVELAVAGLGNVDESQLAAFDAILQPVRGNPELGHLSALLTGFVDELTEIAQRRSRGEIPRGRWADLWAAAMLGAQVRLPVARFAIISGLLHPLGVDVRQHRSMVSAAVWGLLAVPDQPPRVVRIPFVSWKVSVVSGDEIWRLFQPAIDPLLAALASGDALSVTGELSDAGDLRLTSEASPSGSAAPFDLPRPWVGLAPVPALLRHPVHVQGLVALDQIKCSTDALSCAGVTLPLALDRLDVDLDAKLLAIATDMIGVLRWDAGGWRVQPLMLRGKGKLKDGARAGQGIAGRLVKLKSDALVTLRERASRLLRAH